MALLFYFQGDELEFGDTPSLDYTGGTNMAAFTVAFWVLPTTGFSSGDDLFQKFKSYAGGRGWEILHGTSGEINCLWEGQPTDMSYSSSGLGLAVNAWTLVFTLWDVNGGTGAKVLFYKSSEGTYDVTSVSNSVTAEGSRRAETSDLTIGSRGDGQTPARSAFGPIHIVGRHLTLKEMHEQRFQFRRVDGTKLLLDPGQTGTREESMWVQGSGETVLSEQRYVGATGAPDLRWVAPPFTRVPYAPKTPISHRAVNAAAVAGATVPPLAYHYNHSLKQ